MATVVAAFHCYGARRRADESAEITTDTFFLNNARVADTVDLVKLKALMRAILAGDVA